MTAVPTTPAEPPVVLTRAFAPVHKSALGVAVGIVAGLTVFALTAFQIVVAPEGGANLVLLAQYFYGFDLTWPGAFIGMGWGLFTGFVAGWFTAFVRNLVFTIVVFALRSKAELAQTSDFLDHI